jgi:RIO kinase 1
LINDPDPYDEYDLGPLKSGKEAGVFLVERVALDGRTCLLAHKRYRPRDVRFKGELQALGFQAVAQFANDRDYRADRTFANSRDRRAAAKKTRYGKSILRNDWPDNEFSMLQRLAHAGVSVPFPVARTADGVLMQYLGDRVRAAPRLERAGLDAATLARAAELLVDNLRVMTVASIVHADLSVFYLLWWDDTLWIIDVPQAVDLATNDQAFDLLHRDLTNVAQWFRSHAVDFNVDDLFAELVCNAFGS